MKQIINDPLDADLTDEQFRLMKWCDPANDMTYDELKREGDGDFLLGSARVTAKFLGLPEPRLVDDGVDDTAGDVEFHKAVLLSYAEDVPGFAVDERDSLMLTANRLRDMHNDAWQEYVAHFHLDAETLRRVYGVE